VRGPCARAAADKQVIIDAFGDAGKATVFRLPFAATYCSVPYKLDSRGCGADKLIFVPPLHERNIPMSTVSENFVPYAHAERELCDIVGPLLADVIKEVEQRNGIKIRELRVTVEPSTPNALWTGPNVVIVR